MNSPVDKRCGTCEHKTGSWSGWGDCRAPLPFWVRTIEEERVHEKYDGQDCDAYERKEA